MTEPPPRTPMAPGTAIDTHGMILWCGSPPAQARRTRRPGLFA